MTGTCVFIYDYFFPAYKAGGPIQSLINLANALEKKLPISVICSDKDHDGSCLPVEKDKWVPLQNAKVFYATKGFTSYKNNIPPGKNVYFINGIFSLQYNILPIFFLKGRKILSVRGMLHPGALSQKRWKKLMFINALKTLRLADRCEFHATNEEEAGYIKSIFGRRSKVWVVPNLPRQIALTAAPEKVTGELLMGTVALISPMKNHLRVLEALQHCKENITYRIYGPVKDDNYWQKCQAVITTLPPNIHVEYKGDVISTLVPQVISGLQLYIQPSRSENFGHSLYEALACGRPVITSRNTPWNGLSETNAGYNVADDDTSALAAAISAFATMDENTYRQCCQAAASYIGGAVDSESITTKYKEMFNMNVDTSDQF